MKGERCHSCKADLSDAPKVLIHNPLPGVLHLYCADKAECRAARHNAKMIHTAAAKIARESVRRKAL